MLDANGQVIRPPGSDEAGDVETGALPDAGRTGAAAGDAAVVDASAFLADAVRTYLAGVDAFGPEHEVTRDRRDRLRRTLELWDGG